jgi:hypothetical protein
MLYTTKISYRYEYIQTQRARFFTFIFTFIFTISTFYTSVAASYKIYRTWYFYYVQQNEKNFAVKRQIVLSRFLYIHFHNNTIYDI